MSQLLDKETLKKMSIKAETVEIKNVEEKIYKEIKKLTM